NEFLTRMPDLEANTRLFRPSRVLAVQEEIEEALLLLAPVVGVKMRPMLDAMYFEPFVLRSGAHEGFEIAARVQPLPAPVCRREERHLDLRPDRRACLVIAVVERVVEDLAAEID